MSPELVEKLKQIAIKHGKEIAKEMVVEIVFPALEEAVKKSASPVDDVLLAALEAPLKQAALELVEKI